MPDGHYDPETGIVTYFPVREGPALRQAWIDEHVVPTFARRLAEDVRVRSAVLMAVEGDRSDKPHLRDEVHLRLWYSVRDEADAEAAHGNGWGPSPNAPVDRTGWHTCDWFVRDELTPLFAAFCHPGADRARTDLDARSRTARPVVLGHLHRDEPAVFRWRAAPVRPWLDGIRSVVYEGEREFPAAEGDARRAAYVRDVIAPRVAEHFERHPVLQSCALTVGQYWNDNARDEIHLDIVVSALTTPRLESDDHWWISDGTVPGVDPQSSDIELLVFDDVHDMAPLFAACCVGAATQDHDWSISHRVFAIFRRRHDEQGVDVEIVGQVLRPWLDGLRLSPEAWT